MLSLWNRYPLLPLLLPLSLCVTVLTGENVKETQQLDTDTAVQHLTQPSQRLHGSDLAPVNPLFGSDLLGLPLSWPLSSSEESDRQGVIGEYADLQESTDASLVSPSEDGLFVSRPLESATDDASTKENAHPKGSSSGAALPQPSQEQSFKHQPAETSIRSILNSTQTRKNQLTFPALENETTDSHLPFLLFGSLPSVRPEQHSTSPPSAGPEPSPERATQPVATSSLGWTRGPSVSTQGKTQGVTVPMKDTGDVLVDMMDRILHRGAVGLEADKGKK